VRYRHMAVTSLTNVTPAWAKVPVFRDFLGPARA
jgi:hypothetical protein